MLRKKLLEHRETYNENNIRDFTDALLKSCTDEKILNKADLISFTDDHLEMLINDVFVGGVETTLTTLRWCIVYLLHWPEYQNEIYNEIMNVVGPDRYPGLSDRASLPLTECFLLETLRISSLAPLGVPHKATENSSISGKQISKGTQVIFNVWNIHRDERYWESPNEFKPHRWLNEDGRCAEDKHKSFIPFSAGRRICPGKDLARDELFLFMSRLLRDFRITNPPNEPIPSLEGELGITLSPVKFNAVFTPRNNNNI